LPIARCPGHREKRLLQPIYGISDAAAVAMMLALWILSVAVGSYSPFLYCQF